MKILNRDFRIVAVVCPDCQVTLRPVAEVEDCALMEEGGMEDVTVLVMKCQKCGGGVGLACREEK